MRTNTQKVLRGGIVKISTAGIHICTVVWQRLVVTPLGFVQRIAFLLQDAILGLLERLVRWVALNLSPFILLLLFFALGLLFWNYRAQQAPAWIAASISILCGGVLSLLAMGKPIRKDRYIVGVALLFMFLPAALGCWAALQPVKPSAEALSFVTLLEGTETRESLEVDPNWEKEYPYLNLMRSIIGGELRQSYEESKKEPTIDERFSRTLEMASSIDLVEVILFQQMRWKFERDWDVRVDTSNVFGMKSVSIGPKTKVMGLKKNIWRRDDLQKVLPNNRFLDQLPDSYELVLPDGMTITTEPIAGWPNHALIFEDAYCKIRFEAKGKSLTRGFWLNENQERQPFISHLRIGMEVIYKGLRVGTLGTVKREEWLKTLFAQLREPTQMILAD